MQVYEYTAAVLRMAGWGAVRDLAPAVLQCVLLELYSDAAGRSSAHQPSDASGKKRKRQKAQQQQADLAALARGAPAPGSSQVLLEFLLSYEMRKVTKCRISLCTHQGTGWQEAQALDGRAAVG